MDYPRYLKTDAWRKRRTAALKAAGYRCQVCNARKSLEVHHRTYENIGNEQPGDLTVLCETCHELYSKKLPDAPYAWLRKIGIAIREVMHD